jgi:hypothetical protein
MYVCHIREKERVNAVSGLLESLQMVVGNRVSEEQGELWIGHSRYQLSNRVLNYKGKAEAMVLVYLYERAEGFSFYSHDPVVIKIEVKEETIATRTGLNRSNVSRSLIPLEADGAIKVSRERDPLTHQIVTSVYLLLHSQTGNPLLSSPGIWGVCHQNFDRPYIVAPKETREKLKVMTPSGRQVYLTALSLASKNVQMSFRIGREEWKAEARLGRNAFDRGVKECVAKKLLTYSRYTLTLHDPKTGEPSKREKHEFIRHEDAKYKFDYRNVTAAQFQRVIQRLLNREFTVNASGWTHTRPDNVCPFCKEGRSFSVNFTEQKYKCHHCERYGKLGHLVQQVKRYPKWAHVKQYIREVIDVTKTAAEAHAGI